MQRLQVTEHGMKSHQVPGSSSGLFEFARVLVRFDHVALTDLTDFCIFRVTFEPDFTHYVV
jgi:hypothetical protein